MLTASAGVLRQMRVFHGLCDSDLRSLADRCQWREYVSGEQIILHEDQSSDIFFVARGTVRATIYSSTGREILLREFRDGEMFGELAAIDGEPRSAHVIALEDCLIASMKSKVFMEVAEDFPQVGTATLKHLAKQVRGLCRRVYEYSVLSVKLRIRRELLRLAKEHDPESSTVIIAPAPKHAEIAARVSTHREAVTRELNELEQAGIIGKTRGKLTIYDMDRLEQMSQEDPTSL